MRSSMRGDGFHPCWDSDMLIVSFFLPSFPLFPKTGPRRNKLLFGKVVADCLISVNSFYEYLGFPDLVAHDGDYGTRDDR